MGMGGGVGVYFLVEGIGCGVVVVVSKCFSPVSNMVGAWEGKEGGGKCIIILVVGICGGGGGQCPVKCMAVECFSGQRCGCVGEGRRG